MYRRTAQKTSVIIRSTNQQHLAMTIAASFAVMALLASIVVLTSIFAPNMGLATATPIPTYTPSPTPTPFDPNVGALLPNKRIVAYYGIDMSGNDFNGPASVYPFTFLPKLQQLGLQYAAADPVHPVQLGLDIVVQVFSPCTKDTPDCVSLIQDDRLQKYVQYCQDNGLALLLDVQLGRATVADTIAKLMPYLKLPFVHLALDTEFHFPPNYANSAIFNRDGTYNRGWMDATEINYAIQTLAAIPTTYHVPRKVLMIHQFAFEVIHNKPKIVADPRVSIVFHTDGFGAIKDKMDGYRLFVHDQPVQYGGFKLFYHYTDNNLAFDSPLMTPAQVIAQDPPPLLITYQ